jgi:hypothetical protein
MSSYWRRNLRGVSLLALAAGFGGETSFGGTTLRVV